MKDRHPAIAGCFFLCSITSSKIVSYPIFLEHIWIHITQVMAMAQKNKTSQDVKNCAENKIQKGEIYVIGKRNNQRKTEEDDI